MKDPTTRQELNDFIVQETKSQRSELNDEQVAEIAKSILKVVKSDSDVAAFMASYKESENVSSSR